MTAFMEKLKDDLELELQVEVTAGTVADEYTDLSFVLGDSPILLRIKHDIVEDSGGNSSEAVNTVLKVLRDELLRVGRDLRFEFWFASHENYHLSRVYSMWVASEKTYSDSQACGVGLAWAAWCQSKVA